MNKRVVGLTLVFLLLCVFFALAACADTAALSNDSLSVINHSPFVLDKNKKDIETEVYLGGIPLGITVNAQGVVVLEKTPVITAGGSISPLENVDLRRGDIIKSVNGNTVTTVAEMANYIEKGENILSVIRGTESLSVKVNAVKDVMTNRYRIGITVKDNVSGIGTLTFITKDKRFGALGHRITDIESGLSFEFNKGMLYRSEIQGSVKGQAGKPGELMGSIYVKDRFGYIDKNTPFGIFGEWSKECDLETVKTKAVSKIRVGEAEIYTTIFGEKPKKYKINILKLAAQNSQAERSMIIEVTDPELLEKTCGIVQGMSGSPILQDGMLIGAVTHVFTNDPTKGYGIYIPWMLENAPKAPSTRCYGDNILEQVAESFMLKDDFMLI